MRHLIRIIVLGSLALSNRAMTQPIVVRPDTTLVQPKTRIGIGVNGGGGWTNFVGAILVDDPSFEGVEDGNGFARDGWPFYASGALVAAVDTGDAVSGTQSQRITVTGAPASMSQGRVDLPQAPLTMQAQAGHTYRMRVMVRSDTAGARIRLGPLDASWSQRFEAPIAVGTTWQQVEADYRPTTEHGLRGFAIGFDDVATYWIDDFVVWDIDDFDAETGLSATFVARLQELAPASLRLGGLGVNGIPLEQYLPRFWDLDYGPPALQPDLDLRTFLRLCRRVGAQPFITVPPAFSDATHWQLGDLSDDVIANVYEDHGNLIDYLGGDSSTPYGARREADGDARWDLVFDRIYLELGNELWGTPDDRWDMDPNGNETQGEQMDNYATYCQRRMREMRGRPGWRANMRVGFGGRSPATWIGGWPGSYDGTLVPALSGLTDFSTIDLYYGAGTASDSDEAIYGGLFAAAVQQARAITEMKTAFRAANGGADLETTVYEGNATWGGYEADLGNPSPLYFKSVSLGAAVSLVDLYAAANLAGVTVNNHFHFGGNVWGATTPYPAMRKKPAFLALQLFTQVIEGDLAGCTVEGAPRWDDSLTGELGVPEVACYAYVKGELTSLLLINRSRSSARAVQIPGPLGVIERTTLDAADINANNETTENVRLQTQSLPFALADPVLETLPPHSAVVLRLSPTAPTSADGGSDAGSATDAGSDAGPPDAGAGLDGGLGGDPGGRGCGCSTAAPMSGGGLFALVLALLLFTRCRAARGQSGESAKWTSSPLPPVASPAMSPSQLPGRKAAP